MWQNVGVRFARQISYLYILYKKSEYILALQVIDFLSLILYNILNILALIFFSTNRKIHLFSF